MAIQNPLLNDVADLPSRLEAPEPASNRNAAALARAAETTVGLVVENKSRALQEELSNETDQFLSSVEEGQRSLEGPLSDDVIATAIRQPGGGEAIAGEDEALRSVLEEVARLKLAEEQGAIGTTELRIRHESILREATARNPRLAGRYQQAAVEVLGYNPIGAELEALDRASRARQGTEDTTLKQLDDLADELNIDATLKIRNPKEYYGLLIQEAQHGMELAMVDRRLQMFQKTNAYSREEMVVKLAETAPAYAAAELSNVIGTIRQTFGLTSDQRLQGIEAGTFEKVQAQLQAARSQFQNTTRQRYAAPGMSADDIDKAFAPVYDYYDFAIANVNDPKMLETVENFLKAQRNSVLVRYPSLNEMAPVLEVLGKLPQDSPLSISIGRTFASDAAVIFGKAWGGIVDGATRTFLPDGALNPTAANDTLTPNLNRFNTGPADTVKRMTLLARNFTTAAKEAAALSTPESQDRAYRAIVAGAGQNAREYRNQVESDGTRPESGVVREWQRLLASDDFRDIMLKVPEKETLPFAQNMEWMLHFERDQLLAEAQLELQSAVSDKSDIERITFGAIRPGRVPRPKDQAPVRVGDVITVEVGEDGAVVFSSAGENTPAASTLTKDQRKNLDRQVSKLNQTIAPRLTEVIRGLAHVTQSDYQYFASELTDRAKYLVR